MRRNDDDPIARVVREFRQGTFLGNARRRARRRRSAWNLLLPMLALPLWGGFAALLVLFAWRASLAVHSDTLVSWTAFLDGDRRVTIPLVLLPALLASICPAFLAANFLVSLIPPARRAMERESGRIPGADYRSSQRALLEAGAIALGIAGCLMLAGVALGATRAL